jgi:hypothetical protein
MALRLVGICSHTHCPFLQPTAMLMFRLLCCKAYGLEREREKQTYNFKFQIRVIKIYTELEVCKELHAFSTSALYEGVVGGSEAGRVAELSGRVEEEIISTGD